jgi:hypothetical protein
MNYPFWSFCFWTIHLHCHGCMIIAAMEAFNINQTNDCILFCTKPNVISYITNAIVSFFWKCVMTILGSMCDGKHFGDFYDIFSHNLIPFLNHVNPCNIVNKLLVAILILVAQKSTLYFLQRFQPHLTQAMELAILQLPPLRDACFVPTFDSLIDRCPILFLSLLFGDLAINIRLTSHVFFHLQFFLVVVFSYPNVGQVCIIIWTHITNTRVPNCHLKPHVVDGRIHKCMTMKSS